MKYSVYNYTTHAYDVYDGPGPAGAHANAPAARMGRSSMGATPEQASWRVPASATKIGTSSMPQGRIATIGGAALGGSMDTTAPMLGLYALGAYAIWRLMR